MEIYSQNIYNVCINNTKIHVLIIYNISDNHYIGIPIHKSYIENSIYIKSIDRFLVVSDLQEYTKPNIKRFSFY